MLSKQEDSYNRPIQKEDILKSYKIFKRLLLENANNRSKQSKQQSSSSKITQVQSFIPQAQSHLFNPDNRLSTEISYQNLEQQILHQSLTDNPLYKIINIDCHRTRSTNFDQKIKRNLQLILNYFVRTHKIQYKQGLNEIAAPFVLFNSVGASLAECYLMFQKFFIKFSLNFYYDKDFNGLEMFFRMISIVLRYHCPSLSRYLQVYDIQPQIYALSWLMTLFSSKLSLQMTYLLWSYLVAENDRYLLFFIVVGIIIRRKDSIIQTQNSSVFRIVTDMIFKNEEELKQILKISLILRKNTPISLTVFFKQREIFNRLDSYKQSAQIVNHINKLNLFLILPKQLNQQKSHNLQQCKKKGCVLCQHSNPINILNQGQEQIMGIPLQQLVQISNDIKKIRKNIQFVIIDLRKEKIKLNYQKFRSEVHSVDVSFPFEHIQNDFLNIYMESLSSKHFMLLLTGFTFEDITFSDQQQWKCAKKFIQVLNSYSFPHLGILEGGYTALSIYEQQFKIKSEISLIQQNNMISYDKNLAKVFNYKEFISEISKYKLKLPISLMFQIAELKYMSKLKFYFGSQKTLSILTQTFLIVFEDKQGFLQFMSYLQHNCSIVTYFFSNFNSISCKIVKIIPIEKIKSIKGKLMSQKQIVIRYMSQQSNQIQKSKQKQKTISIEAVEKNSSIDPPKQILDDFRELLHLTEFSHIKTKTIDFSQKILKQNPQAKEKQKKMVISLKDKQNVKQMSSCIQKLYKLQLSKRVKNQGLKK